MKVLNEHSRKISQPLEKVAELMRTLATPDDQVWPNKKWPRMHFQDGVVKGAKGGHGPIRYFIDEVQPGKMIRFIFTAPKGFSGFHQLEIKTLNNNQTKIRHVIDMDTKGSGTIVWLFAIKWLHNALMEDAFDKVENHLDEGNRTTRWIVWVQFLRWIFK